MTSGTNPGVWASDDLITNGLAYDITIPATLKPGNYVLRHEIIALHSAENSDGAQNYPFCVNLQVTGSGTELPDGTLGTALYTETDEGILFNIYQDFSSYTIPGPALAFGDDASASSDTAAASSVVATSAAAAATTAAVTDVAVAAAAATTAAATEAPVATPAATEVAATPAAAATAKSSCKKRRHARAIKN